MTVTNFNSFPELIELYWNSKQLSVNFLIFLNLLGSLILGMALGLERTMHGRAAGLRTYGIVATAACALTVFTGYPNYWFGGQFAGIFIPDPGRVIQGIITGVGFLGAGVIMKDGFSITGLSTAASIWMCSAIGVLVGIGFYAAAMSLTFLAILTMYFVSMIESRLPQRTSYSVEIVFVPQFVPDESRLREKSLSLGLNIPKNGINVSMKEKQQTWNFNCHSLPDKPVQLTQISSYLSNLDGIAQFEISKTRI